MKTALLVIPATNGKINRKKYISDCINDVIKQGYMPFCYDIFSDYAKVSYSLFLSTTLPFCDVVFAYADFGDEVNTMDLIRELAPDKDVLTRTLVGDESEYTYVLEDILKEVAIKRNIQVRDLKGPSKRRELVDTRYIFFRRAKKCTEATLGMIGQTVDRHHSTVLHGLREMEKVRELQTLYRTHYGDEHEA